MIVVFDSGIWVSAMEFGGTPLEAVIKAIAQDRLAVCDQIEEEVVRVLTRKFGWEAAECIVTGDDDLLSLKSHGGIRIVTAGEYAQCGWARS